MKSLNWLLPSLFPSFPNPFSCLVCNLEKRDFVYFLEDLGSQRVPIYSLPTHTYIASPNIISSNRLVHLLQFLNLH
jgi:hypothetical protein